MATALSSLMGELVCLETDEECWFAVQTRYRFEKKVALALSRKGMKVFLPLRAENRAWCDRNRIVNAPLFPGYAFVQGTPSLVLRLQVLETAGVLGFASTSGAMAVVPGKQIDDLQTLLEQQICFETGPFLGVGRRARIREGCLRGLEGLIAPPDPHRLVIAIAAVQRSLSIAIESHELEWV